MKKFLFVAAIFLFLNITGCYTVIWSPGMDFPTGDNSQYNSADTTGYYNSSDTYGGAYGDAYYNEPYFGPYAGYYNIPWWYSIAPPTTSKENNKNNGKTATNRSGDVSPIRNSGDGRGDPGRNTAGDIINTPPVSVSGSGNTNSGTTTSGSENKGSNSGSDNNTRQSSGSGSVRNNDGNRNDGGRK